MAMLFGVATLAGGLSGCEQQSPVRQLCGLLTAIASDPNKVAYIKKWIGSHLEDEKFRETLRDFNSLRAHDERMQRFGDLDWKYLGIAEGIGTVEFHGALNAGHLDVSRINAVEMSVGRSSIFVRLSSDNSAGQSWSPEHLAEMRAFGEDVFVSCGEET